MNTILHLLTQAYGRKYNYCKCLRIFVNIQNFEFAKTINNDDTETT